MSARKISTSHQSQQQRDHDVSKLSADFVNSQNNFAMTAKSTKPENNLVYMDSDFWYHKGVVLNGKDQNKSAV